MKSQAMKSLLLEYSGMQYGHQRNKLTVILIFQNIPVWTFINEPIVVDENVDSASNYNTVDDVANNIE